MENSDINYNPIKTLKAADMITQEIWDMILSGQLKPGTNYYLKKS